MTYSTTAAEGNVSAGIGKGVDRVSQINENAKALGRAKIVRLHMLAGGY
jgi:hypothetical protein